MSALRSAVIAAVVAALVAGGGAIAATQISGRMIRPHSMPLNRLVRLPAAQARNVHLTYIAGQESVVQPGSTGYGTATCPHGQVAVSGGYALVAQIDANQIVGLTSAPMQQDLGWAVGYQDAGTTPATVISYALCVTGTASQGVSP